MGADTYYRDSDYVTRRRLKRWAGRGSPREFLRHAHLPGYGNDSLEPKLSVPDLVPQLWRKIDFSPKLRDFSPKLRDKIRNGKPGFEAKETKIWKRKYATERRKRK